ncbi:PREDICTED: uncharacterized protein LOC109484493 [Branchiostoma belcheri]|uniref:Uncharacterized protein LOC109484493 n=1 Tax=Branchiostoma belcheri TaxID=7741 RepID=A0A6P5AJR0_BRABE|nr:PREDICTED: uncharacterized protein LOC109484493 [Branchiostoma belcheri]
MLRVATLALLVFAVAAYPADYRGSGPEKCDGENRLSPGHEYTYNYTVEGYRKPLANVEDKILWFKWLCSAHIKVYGPCEMVLSTPYCEVLKAVTSDMEEEREYRTFAHGKSYTREFTEDVDLPFYMNLGEVTSISPKVDGPLHVLNLHRDMLSMLQLPTRLDDLDKITAHRSVHGDCAPRYEITDSVDLSGTSVALGVRMLKDMSKCQHPDNVFQDEVMEETLGDASQQCDYVMNEEGRIDKVTCREQTPDNYLHHNNPFLIANNTRKLVFVKKDPLKVLKSEDAYDKDGRYYDDLIFKIDEPTSPQKSPRKKAPSDCRPVRCRMFCKFGWQIDENGCEVCRCNQPGQYLLDKEKCIGKNRFEPGRRYIYNYTVEGKKESPAHMGKTLWLRSTYRVVLDAIDACHAIITTPKCEILNAETSDDSEKPEYSSFAQGVQYAKAFTQDYPLIVYWNKGLVEVIAPQVDMPVYILNMRREILSLLQMPIDVPEGKEQIRNVYGECRPEFEITDQKIFLNNRVVTGVNVRNELTQCKHPESSWEEVFGVQLTNATRECKYHLSSKGRIQKVSCKEVMEDASLSYNNPFMIANSRSHLNFLGTRSLPDPVPTLSMENRRKTDLVFEMEEQADSRPKEEEEKKEEECTDAKCAIVEEVVEVPRVPVWKQEKGEPVERTHVDGGDFVCKDGNQFQPGYRYLYGYYGKAQGKMSSQPGKDGYWVTARCWVEIEVTSKCSFYMKTANCVFRDSEPRVPGDKVDKEFHKLSANLGEHPIYVELNHGLVHRLVVDPSESTHILNTKRAILSTLQMHLAENPRLNTNITQGDIYGDCPVNYVISEVEEGHVVGMNVTKHVSKCKHPKEEMASKMAGSHSGAHQTCRSDLTHDSVIERVICKDVRPVREDRMIETHRILVLQHVRPLKPNEPQYRFDIEEGKETSLTYEAEEGKGAEEDEETISLRGGLEAKTPCKPVRCKMYCEHGFRTDKRGCEICECAKEGEGTCTDDDGVTRKNGEKWRPSFDEDWCNSCHCENGKVACLGVVCANPDCGNEAPVKVEGQCCPVCPDEEKPQKPGDIKQGVCTTKDGQTYKDGELWEEKDCTKCMCMEGEAVCTSVLCEVPDCGEGVEPIMNDGDCCPKCPEVEKCTSSDGKEYVAGETWEEDGSCTTCRCEGEKTVCMSMMCDWPQCEDGAEPVKKEGECCPSCPVDANALETLVSSNGKFALELYKQLTRQADAGNVFVSPFSISTALAMTYLAAKGKTAEQMGSTMHFQDLSDLTLHKTFAELTETTSSNLTSYTLSVANKLFVQEDFDLLKTYIDGVERHYGSDVGRVNFGDAKVASDMINNWVEEKTQQKIHDLIQEDMLNDLTRVVLVNAIYFKGQWADMFDPYDTADMPFYRTEEDSVDIPMMFREGRYNSVRDPDVGCSVLELPYKDKDLSMLVIVPTEKEGLAQVESKITMETLQRWNDNFVNKLTLVYLPKYKIEYAVSVTDHLKRMGMEDLFDRSRADLSGLTGERDLHVSDVVHKAFVEVYEKGSEAAAATGVQISLLSAKIWPEPPVTVRADRPFLFFIRDNRNHSILFMGRVTDPIGNK